MMAWDGLLVELAMPEGMEDATCAGDAQTTPTRAYGRLLLPVIKLKASASSRQLEHRLNYLWSSAHALLATSPTLAHTMAASIMAIAREQRLQLPSDVLDYLCEQCGGLLVPSLSATVRVQSQRDTSRTNRKLRRVQRKRFPSSAVSSTAPRRELLQNALHVTCLRCNHATTRAGASAVHKIKPKKRPLDTADEAASVDAKRVKRNEPGDSEQPVAKSVFATPASPPRKLLDGKRKKKPKKPDAATTAVKSGLNSFLQTLRPSFAK
ncbi:hypothetical protein Poli38472_011617 [Pythium oligandrum]|uniref:Uncharacterized protein n=1 Tax=Pythium oligandrum TaxID=41045 RepID=A0A8K1CLX4_PYTOL|nr:hypothetical protein Poli38472_011617 [Pythium oligandrum]|eukprot:TMW64737.1 hypothetical protein Poli38472_011617 [Pythium oligandrum]